MNPPPVGAPMARTEVTGAPPPWSYPREDYVNTLKEAAEKANEFEGHDNRPPGRMDMGMYWGPQYRVEQRQEHAFETTQYFPFPEEFLQQQVDYKRLMGIFPDISRAWITFDNRIFLWNFSKGPDFVCYDQLDQIIISAGVVKPKPGVFVEEIQYLLILATPLEVIIIGIRFERFEEEGVFGEMTLHNTQLSVPTDNVNILKISGTEDGRVFMCGGDGNLYELLYDAEDGFFYKKCRKQNHTQYFFSSFMPSIPLLFSQEDAIIDCAVDDSRRVLYTLSERSVIQAFDLANGLKSVGKYTEALSDLDRQGFGGMAGTNDQLKIIAIFPIPWGESNKNDHLVAVSNEGHRLYLSTFPPAFYGYADATWRPVAPEFNSVRDLGTHARRPGTAAKEGAMAKAHAALYADGVLLAAGVGGGNDTRDLLVGVCPEAGTGVELVSKVEKVQGRVAAIAETPAPFTLASSNALELQLLALSAKSPWDAAARHPSLRNELAVQHLLPPRQFRCLTDKGMHVISKLRPIDWMLEVLAHNDTRALAEFDRRFGPAETCAIALAIATSSAQTGPVMVSPYIVQHATSVFFKHNDRPTKKQDQAPEDTNGMGGIMPKSEIVYSGKHDGLYMHFSRLVRFVWNFPIVGTAEECLHPGAPVKTVYVPAPWMRRAVLNDLERSLENLRSFLDQHPQFVAPVMDDRLAFDQPPDMSAERAEQQSLHALSMLLGRCLEAVRFLHLICQDHALEDLARRMDVQMQAELAELTFHKLVVSHEGMAVANALVTALIMKIIENDGRNLEAIGDKMMRQCPGYFSKADLHRYKGFEKLHQAEQQGERERPALLRASLEEFRVCAETVALAPVAERYAYLRFYEGVLDLALARAVAVDPDNEFSTDDQHDERLKCYGVIKTWAFDELMNSSFPRQWTSVTGIAGERPGVDTVELERMRDMFLKQAMSSTDQDFHYELFMWFINEGKEKELLELQSPYLCDFLKLNEERFGLLWQYFVKNKQYMEAAEILLYLAELPGKIDLKTRLEYLSLAIANAKSAVGAWGANRDVFVKDLEYKHEVAHIQWKILRKLQVPTIDFSQTDRNLIETLDSSLVPLVDLYKKYTKPFKLYEESLAVLHCGSYSDAKLVRDLWTALIHDREHGMFAEADPLRVVARLSRLYHDADKIFPLDFLVKELEERFQRESGYQYHAVASAFHDGGVPWPALFDAYNRLLADASKHEDVRMRYYHVIYYVVVEWQAAARASGARSYERQLYESRRPLWNVSDTYMADLASFRDPQAAALSQKFDDLRR